MYNSLIYEGFFTWRFVIWVAIMIHKSSMFDYKLGHADDSYGIVALSNADLAYLAYIEIAVAVYTYNRPSWLFTLDMMFSLVRLCGYV